MILWAHGFGLNWICKTSTGKVLSWKAKQVYNVFWLLTSVNSGIKVYRSGIVFRACLMRSNNNPLIPRRSDVPIRGICRELDRRCFMSFQSLLNYENFSFYHCINFSQRTCHRMIVAVEIKNSACLVYVYCFIIDIKTRKKSNKASKKNLTVQWIVENNLNPGFGKELECSFLKNSF